MARFHIFIAIEDPFVGRPAIRVEIDGLVLLLLFFISADDLLRPSRFEGLGRFDARLGLELS